MRAKWKKTNQLTISNSMLEDAYRHLVAVGKMRKCELVRLMGYKSNGADSLLIRFESAGLLLSEDPVTGEIRAWV